jgi:hypothetical protein
VAARAAARGGLVRPPAVTEREWQGQVLDLARLYRWRAYHPYLSKWSEPGWPDLALVRPPRLVFAELKRDGAQPTAAQREWLDLLADCGQEVYLWRPEDLDRIVAILR